MFVDTVELEVQGGHGGAGVAAFEKRRGRPRGKPTGGDGGKGGDVILVADPRVASLLRYERSRRLKAGDGTHGQGDLRHGRAGDDLLLPVPLGTVVFDEDGTLLADLVEPGQRVVVARGGRGGRGNAAFVARRRRAPEFCEQGEYGERRRVRLELRLVADAALIGYPNAGKSTLISRLSAARPKVADYPFTTLQPHLGVVSVGEREFVLADVPGLVEGAAAGRGLGHLFLRHVERSRVLIVLLDPSPLQTDPPSRQWRVLLDELSAWSPDLLERPRVVVLGKVDLPEADDPRSTEWATEEGIDLLRVSSVTGEGLDTLVRTVADLVARARREAPEREGFVLHRPLPEGFTVTRRGGTWVVEGRAALRAVNLDDLTRPEAADLVARRLARIGVDEALRRAGVRPGDDVRIGELVFTYAEPGHEGEEEEEGTDVDDGEEART